MNKLVNYLMPISRIPYLKRNKVFFIRHFEIKVEHYAI